MQDGNRIPPKPVRFLLIVIMLVGLWSSTFGFNFSLEVVQRCTAIAPGDALAQWKHWCTEGFVWYLAIRLYGEAIVLALRGAGSGRFLSPHDPRGVLRLLAGWELVAVFAISVCVVALTHGCNQCDGIGLHGSCDADIGYRVFSMGVGILVLRCLRVTGYALAPTADWA